MLGMVVMLFLATSGGPESSAVRVGDKSLSLETFQIDVEARTPNTATLFAGVYLTVESLRGPLSKSISSSSMISELLNRLHNPMTSIPIGAAWTSARRSGSGEWLEVKSGLHGATRSTLLQ